MPAKRFIVSLAAVALAGCSFHAPDAGPLRITALNFQFDGDRFHPEWTLELENLGSTTLMSPEFQNIVADVIDASTFEVRGSEYHSLSPDVSKTRSGPIVKPSFNNDGSPNRTYPFHLLPVGASIPPGGKAQTDLELLVFEDRATGQGKQRVVVNDSDFYLLIMYTTYSDGAKKWESTYFPTCYNGLAQRITILGEETCVSASGSPGNPSWVPYKPR